MPHKTSDKYDGRCVILGDRAMTGDPTSPVTILCGNIEDDEPLWWTAFTAGVPSKLEYVSTPAELTPGKWTFVRK